VWRRTGDAPSQGLFGAPQYRRDPGLRDGGHGAAKGGDRWVDPGPCGAPSSDSTGDLVPVRSAPQPAGRRRLLPGSNPTGMQIGPDLLEQSVLVRADS
jgi:hypothetical protein